MRMFFQKERKKVTSQQIFNINIAIAPEASCHSDRAKRRGISKRIRDISRSFDMTQT